MLQEHEAGAKCADLYRKHGMSEGTFYAWKAQYSGMTVLDATRLTALFGPSERRTCQIAGADRKTIRYRLRRSSDAALRGQLRDLANGWRRFGYRRLFALLRREGESSGINRFYRRYSEEGLTVRERKARRMALGPTITKPPQGHTRFPASRLLQLSPNTSSPQSPDPLHAMKAPRTGRLLNPRRQAQMTTGLRSWLDE